MGNYIGTNPSGSAAIPNVGSGILVAESSSITIGGTLSAGQRNVVSGNLGSGINLYSSTGVSIYGNYIGVGANLSALGNGGAGVWLSTQSASNTIGSTGTRAGNRIANNLSGVNLASSAYSANSIRGNNIYANENLGIDLLDNGVTANDIGDGDTGPNDLMNYPVVQTATSDVDGTRITGYFSSQANLTVNIDFYRSAICDASGYGEGENLVGSVQVTTDGSGVIFFDESFTYEVPDGYAITATATDEDGNTSEFSACMEVQGRELAKIYLPFITRKP
jgi:hypothetical protein